MLIGLLAGLATCALWGLSFVAPRAVEPFTAMDLTVARYGIFGLTSVLLMAMPRFRPRGLSRGLWGMGLLMGGLGYTGYFLAVAQAVRLAGPAIPPLVIGLMPVMLALIANARERVLPWGRLAPPLGLIGAGVLIVNLGALAGGAGGLLPGMLAAFAALALWVVYGLLNAEVMRSPRPPEALHWTAVQALGAGLGSLVLLPLTSEAVPPGGDLRGFVFWALLTGVAGSWLATWFWVVASQRLPLALAAQLIVAETVFGLVFGFAFEGRGPSLGEAVGAAVQIAGVLLAIAAFQRRAAPEGAATPP